MGRFSGGKFSGVVAMKDLSSWRMAWAGEPVSQREWASSRQAVKYSGPQVWRCFLVWVMGRGEVMFGSWGQGWFVNGDILKF